jgi:hypothetical protein
VKRAGIDGNEGVFLEQRFIFDDGECRGLAWFGGGSEAVERARLFSGCGFHDGPSRVDGPLDEDLLGAVGRTFQRVTCLARAFMFDLQPAFADL